MFVVPGMATGGAERHVATLLPELDPARIAPSVVCIGPAGELLADVVEGGFPGTALDRRERPVAALLGLVRRIRRERPDVVVTRGYNAETLGRIAAALCGVRRSVVWVHNCGDLVPRGRVRRVLDRLLDPVTAAYYGVAHGQRPYLVDDLGYPDRKVVIVRNGTGPGAGPPPAVGRRRERWVGIVAVLRPEKDHRTFLRAARHVVDRAPATRFLVIGDGPERAALERLAGELGLDGIVEFTGNRSDVPTLLHELDVFVLSSTTIECLPMALLEAMSAELPAVCTAVGGIPEMIEDGVTGFLVPRRDAAALADRILDLVGNPDRSRAMGRAARRRLLDEFSLDRSVEAAQQALERTAGRRTPGAGVGEPAAAPRTRGRP